MKFISYILGYLVYYIIYVLVYNLFGETGFMFYIGTLISHIVGGYLGSVVTGILIFKKSGTRMNFLIPLMFCMTIIGGVLGVIRHGWGEIWEYLVVLVGLFVAFGFFNMYVIKHEG